MHPFVHLHVHSQYSILDGQASIQALVDKAMHDGMRGIAITDHGNMFGIKEFYNYVNKKNGPIFNEIKDLKKKIVAIEKGETECENKETEIARFKIQIEETQKNYLNQLLVVKCTWPGNGYKTKTGNLTKAVII